MAIFPFSGFDFDGTAFLGTALFGAGPVAFFPAFVFADVFPGFDLTDDLPAKLTGSLFLVKDLALDEILCPVLMMASK
jgi:hypothetical protein